MKVDARAQEEEYGLLLRNGSAIPLTGVEVSGDIIGNTARVRVTQEFYNSLSQPIEAIYKFPLPESAAQCGFTATVDGRQYAGRIEERNKAYEVYDDAIQAGNGGFLLDEDRPNIFTLSVGNMKPKTSAVISLTYVTMLDVSVGETRFFLPTTISPRYVPRHTPERDGIPADEIVNPPVALSVPYGLTINLAIHDRERISSVESPSHRIRTDYAEDRILVSFSGEKIAMDRDFILTFTRKAEFLNACYYQRDGADLFFQLDMTLTGESDGAKGNARKMRREIIFLIDCSGSMEGSSIEGAKNALDAFLQGLSDEISFNIFRFGSTFESLFNECLPYTRENRDRARHYLNNMQADLGGTEMYRPLRTIYSDPVPPNCLRSIVFLTDGEVGDEEQIIDLVKQNAVSTQVFSVGIGYGPNEYLIKQIARSSGGWHEMISPGERIEPKVLSMFSKVVSGPVEEINIDWKLKVDQAPAVPVIFQNTTTSIFGCLHHSYFVPSQIEIRGAINGEERTWTTSLHEVHAADNQLPILWAREKIKDLQNEKKHDAKKKIIVLSKTFGIISPETSFVAIEERQEHDKSADKMVRVKVPAMLTKDWGGEIKGCMAFDILDEEAVSSPTLFDRAERGLTKKNARADLLMEILSCQRAEGGFEIDALLHRIGIPMDELRYISGKIKYEKISYLIDRIDQAIRQLQDLADATAHFSDAHLVDDLKTMIQRLQGMSREISSAEVPDHLVLLSTVLVIILLREKMSSRRNEWEYVIKKSKDWLDRQLDERYPVIYGQKITDWVSNNLIGRITVTG